MDEGKIGEGDNWLIYVPRDLATRGHDAVFYTNTVEDPGSISVMVVDPDIIDIQDIHEGPVDEMDPKFSFAATPAQPARMDMPVETINYIIDKWGGDTEADVRAHFARADINAFLDLTTTVDDVGYGTSRSEIETDPFTTSNIQPDYQTITQDFDPREVDRPRQQNAIPYITIVSESGRVTAHEGRHRAASLKRGGAKTMPIIIKTKAGVPLPITLTGQFDTTIGRPMFETIPAVEGNQEAIKALVGEGSGEFAEAQRMRYGIVVRRPGKKSITRYVFATSNVEARNIVANSSAIRRGASEVGQPFLDDPAFDAAGPKRSVRNHKKKRKAEGKMDLYDEETTFIGSDRDIGIDIPGAEGAIGYAYIGHEPFPIALMKGYVNPKHPESGFGYAHMLEKSKRFDKKNPENAKKVMDRRFYEFLDASRQRGNQNIRVRPFKRPDEPVNKLDWTITWKSPEGTIFALGVEKWISDKDGHTYLAVNTFFPDDLSTYAERARRATDEDILEFRERTQSTERKRDRKRLKEEKKRRREASKIMKFRSGRLRARQKRSIGVDGFSIPNDAVAVDDVSRTNDGRYYGGPTKMMTPRQVRTLIDRLTRMALSARAVPDESRFWYENAGTVIKSLSQGDLQIMEDTIRIVALLSKDNQLGANISGSIDIAYDVAKNGKPTIGRGRYPNELLKELGPALAADQFDSRLDGVSNKVMSFYRNMRDTAYGTKDFEGESALDVWMYRAFGYTAIKEEFVDAKYPFGRMVMQRVAAKLSDQLGTPILPRQAQAMIWTAQRNIDVEPVDATMVGFEHYFDRHDAVVTWEANPSVKTNIFPEIFDQPMEVQRQFAKEARELTTSNGQDILLHMMGVPLTVTFPGEGTYEARRAPNLITHIILPRTEDKTYDTSIANFYAQTMGYIQTQDMTPWHRADPTLTIKESNPGVAAVVEAGTVDNTALYRFARTHFPSSDFSLVTRLDGVEEYRFIDYEGGMKPEAYTSAIKTILANFDADVQFGAYDFKSTGPEYDDMTNDWKENPNGESYRQRTSKAGRPDIQKWAYNRRQAFLKLVAVWKTKIDPNAGHGRQRGEGLASPTGEILTIPPIEPDGTVISHHWSENSKIKNTLPHRYGTGIPGDEIRRKRTYRDLWKDRTYFGVGVGRDGGYLKERALGDHLYEARIPYEKLFDFRRQDPNDPNNFWKIARNKWGNDRGAVTTEVEKLIQEAGYVGYWTTSPQGLAIAAFKKVPVKKVDPEPSTTKKSYGPPLPSQVGLRVNQLAFENDARQLAEDENISFEEAVRRMETDEELAISGRGLEPKYSVAPPRPEDGIYERLIEGDKTIWDRAGRWLRKQFAPGGMLSALAEGRVFEEKITRDSEFRANDNEIEFLVRSLDKAVMKNFGTRWNKLSEGHKQEINALLAGAATSTLPTPIKQVVFAMRQYIDRGSGEYSGILRDQAAALVTKARATGDQRLIADAEGKKRLIDILADNMGEYVHRSYKVFDDPRWHEKVSHPVFDRAMNYLMSTGQYTSQDDAATTIAKLIKGEATAFTNMEAYIKESTLGAKDLTALKKRNEIAPEIRELMGEYDDARINFSRTSTKINRLIFNQKFLDSVLGIGEGVFLFHEPNQTATHKIAAAGSETMSPLNGMWASPETIQAFKDALGKSESQQWLRNIYAANAAIKVGKTLYSPITQMRNFQSAYMFTIANGHFDFTHMAQAWRTMKDYVGTLPGETRDYHTELVRQGVLYNNPHAGVLMDLLKDSKESQLIDKVFFQEGGTIKEKIRDIGKVVQKLYMAGDDFWKIVGFENELAYVMKAKGWTREEATPFVAKRIRDTYPTYSMVGSLLVKLRKFPLAGTFVSFPAEVIRTNINIVRLIKSDLADPDMRSMARRRMAGMAIAHSWAGAVAAVSATAMGLTDDEEEALRLMGSPWAENSSFLFWGRDRDGNVKMQDLSFTDPYNLLHRPFTAMMRDLPWEEKAVSAFTDLLSPFLGADIAFGALYEIVRNEKTSGGRVFNPDEGSLEQTLSISSHLIDRLQPGVTTQVGRMLKAVQGKKSPSGRVYDRQDELMAWFGFRISTFDPRLSLYYRTFEFTESLGNARSILSNAAKDVNVVSNDELVAAFETANDSRLKAYKKMRRFVNGARSSGVNNSTLRRILRTSGVSAQYANHLVKGKPAPKWRIGKTFLKGAVKRARLLIDRETAKEIKRRGQFVRSAARALQ